MTVPVMRILKKILLITAGIFAGMILLAVVCMLIFPHVVSSRIFKDRLETILTDTLEHTVKIEDIDWTWRRGIAISGVRLQDHPDFSDELLVAIRDIDMEIEWSQLLRRRLAFDLSIVEPRIHILRSADGRINILDGFAKREPLPEKLKPEKKTRTNFKPFFLPVDITGTFELNDLSLVLNDCKAERHIEVTKADLRLDLPSLKNEAVHMTLLADMAIDHKPLPRSAISAMVSGLFDEAGCMNIQNTALEADIDLPGFTAILSGNMKDTGIKGDIDINLETVADLAFLFAPGLAEQMRPVGRIHIAANSYGMPDMPIAFDMRISGKDLGLSGPINEKQSLSSGNIQMHAAGTYDSQKGSLALHTGQIHLLKNTHLELSGRIDGLMSKDPSVDLTIASLKIHMDEVVEFFTDFIPNILVFPGSEGPSLFSIQQLVFSGGLKTGKVRVFCKDLELDLPHISFVPDNGTNRMNLSGARLNISDVQIDMMTYYPVSAEINASILADAFDLTLKDRSVSIKNINLYDLGVRGDNIRKIPYSSFGFTGTFALNESLHMDTVSAAPLIDIKALDQSLTVKASLDADGNFKAKLDGMRVNIGKASTILADGKPFELSGSLDTSLQEFTLSKMEPFTVNLSGFKTDLNVDDALTVSIRADVADTGRSMVRSQASLRADLALLAEKFKDFIEPGIAAKGTLDLDLNIDGRLPDEKARTGLKNMQLAGNLDFLNKLALKVILSKGQLGITPNNKNRLAIDTISANPLFAYTLHGVSGEGNLDCQCRIDDIEGIPGLKPETPLSAHFILNGTHRFLSAVDLDQRLQIDPIDIRQAATISLDMPDGLLTSGNLGTPYEGLYRVGATMSAGVDIADLSTLKDMGVSGMRFIDLSGSVSARTGLHMIPDNRISSDVRIDIAHANIDLKDTMAITGADADIEWSKTYRLVVLDPENPDRLTNGALLSRRVLQPETLNTVHSLNSSTDIYRHLKQLKERTSPTSEISVGSLSTHRGPLPFHMGPLRIVMDAVNGVPGINHFQFDLLGGTINGTVNLLKKDWKDFRIRSTLNFSGVNTAAFFPELYSDREDRSAEICGMVYADIPVTHQMPVLLENMVIKTEFTKIGSQAIERLLFAMDPHESNEAVMAQRRILKNGSPRWIRLDIRDGFLSIRGEVAVRNINIRLPDIQRLNIARLPGIEDFESAVASLETVALLLGRLSAETLAISSDGKTILFR